MKSIKFLPIYLAVVAPMPAFAQNVQGDIVAQGFSESLGVSLAEAQRRLELLADASDVAKKLEASIGGRYGGLRITNDASTFKAEFLITGNPDKELAAFTNRPEFTASRVSRSYNSLKNRFGQLSDALKNGNEPFVVVVSTAKNKVEVVHRPNANARSLLRATKLFDDMIEEIETDEPFVPTATVYGGTYLTNSFTIGSTTYTETGTIGFVVEDPSVNVGSPAKLRRGIVTAGHVGEPRSSKDCSGKVTAAPTGYPVNGPFKDDASGVTFNFIKQAIDTNTDAEFRVPASGTHTLRNEIKYGASGATVMAITAKYDPRNWTPPTFAFCKQGRTTKYLCGTIDSNNVSFTGNGIQQYFLRGVSSTAGAGIVAPGDSGGPVFVSGGAVGLTVGAGGAVGTCPNFTYTTVFIEPIAVVESALGVSVATTP